MTPEERAQIFISENPNFIEDKFGDMDRPLADCIRTAENDILDVAAAQVMAMLPGNPFAKLVADLILLQKQVE